MLKGSCLCGGVHIEVHGEIEHQPEICHCTQCRKQSGHALAALNVHRDKLIIHGDDKVSWYRSSEKVERGFCGVCGSTLFWKPNVADYHYTAVAMGMFDETTGTHLVKQTFVGDKGDYYNLDESVSQSESY